MVFTLIKIIHNMTATSTGTGISCAKVLLMKFGNYKAQRYSKRPD